MPVEFTIDRDSRLIQTRANGKLTAADFVDGRERLRAHPAFEPSLHELLDLRGVTEIAIQAVDLPSIAAGSVLSSGVRRAIVVGSVPHVELARMFANLAASRGQRVLVFRDVSVAHAWLAATGAAATRAKPA